jgi:hypothetical protein
MALTQPDCPPAVAESALRVLRGAQEPVSRAKIVGLLSPGSSFNPKVVGMVLRDLASIGVIVEEDAGLRLSRAAAARQANAAAIRACMFDAVDADELWALADDGKLPLEGGRDLVRALAWFCGLDVPDGPYVYEGDIDELQQRELAAEVIATPERWPPFARWGSYLGMTRVEPKGLSPDPSRALLEVLGSASSGSPWPPAQFLDLVAAELPVLDGGRFRLAVTERRRPDADGQEADISSALAFALLTLEKEGVIEIERSTGDARKLRLPHELGACSGVIWKGLT